MLDAEGNQKQKETVISNDKVIYELVSKLIVEQPYLDAEGNQIKDSEGNPVPNPNFKGETPISVAGT